MKKLLLILLCLPMIGLGQETGCTDSSSLEYNSLAIKDDGSCLYDIYCLFYSNDSNTAYTDFSKTKKVTGWVEMDSHWCLSKKQLIDGKSTNKYTLSEWLEDPCPGQKSVVYWIMILFIWIPVIITLTYISCLLYTSPSPRDKRQSRMPSSA